MKLRRQERLKRLDVSCWHMLLLELPCVLADEDVDVSSFLLAPVMGLRVLFPLAKNAAPACFETKGEGSPV